MLEQPTTYLREANCPKLPTRTVIMTVVLGIYQGLGLWGATQSRLMITWRVALLSWPREPF
jgi:hypothetical protein